MKKVCDWCQCPFAGPRLTVPDGWVMQTVWGRNEWGERQQVYQELRAAASDSVVCQQCFDDETARSGWSDEDVLHLETGLAGVALDRMLKYRQRKLEKRVRDSWLTQSEWEYRYPNPIPVCSLDGGITRAGRFPVDEDDVWGFVGLCMIDPTKE